MPSTVNGVGTHYYGKQNREVNAGVCQHCHQQVELQNYETRLWFCVIFIPVIPLGRKQILDYCPACTMHTAIPFADWEAMRNEAIGESADELRDNKDDPEAGLKMLGTLAAFHKTDGATKLARMLRDQHSDHAMVQFSAGGWLEQCGHSDEASACFEQAWKLEPDKPEYRRAWGMTLAERGQLNEARELLSIFEEPDTLDPGTVYFLALQFQARDDHKQAIELFGVLLGLAPALGKDKDFRKAVRTSEKANGGETSILPRRSIFASKAFWWTAVCSLLVGGVVLTSQYVASNRTVHVVNGSQASITVSIDDGPPQQIAPLSRTAVKLTEDTHTWKLTDPLDLADQGQFDLSTGFLSRLFDAPAFVLDPSRTTVTVFERATYAANAENSTLDTRVHVGQPFLIFDDADHIFEPFSDEIRGKSSEMQRTRVDSLLFDPSVVIGTVQKDITPQQQLELCEHHLLATHSNENLLELYVFFAYKQSAHQRVYEFLQRGLDWRPIEMSWHRMYQNAAAMLGRDDELFAQYDLLLESDADSSALLYLRGRIEPNSTAAGDYYDRAIAADPKNFFPLMASAHRALSLAQFDEALERADRALLVKADNGAGRIRFSARMALGEWKEIEEVSRATLADDPMDTTAHFRLLAALATQGRMAEVKQTHDAYALSVRNHFPNDPYGSVSQSERYVAMSERDYQRALQVTLSMPPSTLRSQAEAECLVELERFDELQNVGLKDHSLRAYYELYASVHEMLSKPGHRWSDLASSQRALQSLRQGDAESKLAAGVLESASENPDTLYDDVIGITLQPRYRIPVCLAAAAQSSGEDRSQLLDLAEQLIFMPTYPRGITERYIKAMRR